MREGFIPRTTGAVLLALLLAASLFLTLSPVGATHGDADPSAPGNPSSECGIDDPFFAKYQYSETSQTFSGKEGSADVDVSVVADAVNWVNNELPDHEIYRIVFKLGQGVSVENLVLESPPQTGSQPLSSLKGLSHVTFCLHDPGDTTTTTEQVTTTTEQVTTTTEQVTTTTEQGTTTTTEQGTTTTDVSVLAVQITTSSVSAETLPFTGSVFGEGGALGLATAMLALGGMAVLAVRRREDDAATVAEGWSDRLWTVE